MRTPSWSGGIELPPDFRPQDFFAFHRRDPLMVAERVTADTLEKGLVWEGRAAILTLRLQQGRATAELSVDGAPEAGSAIAVERMVRRMLGLTQRIGDFEARYRDHPQLGELIARHPGLRVPLAATPFEALIWAVTGQQISVQAAISLRRRLIQAAGVQHCGGLACFPDAGHLAALNEVELRRAGFSRAKTRALLALSQTPLPWEEWAGTLPVEEIRTGLLAIPGVGPWTVSYALLRGFGWLDGSLHGDVAVRRGLQRLLHRPEPPETEETQRWLAAFSPWRALVAAHLWALQSTQAY